MNHDPERRTITDRRLSTLSKAMYVYRMAACRHGVRQETLDRLEMDLRKACADIAFPVDVEHPSNAAWAPQTAPTTEQARLARDYLKVLDGGLKKGAQRSGRKVR